MSSNEISFRAFGNSYHYIACISCPFCAVTISVPYTFGQDSVDPIWNISIFDGHVKMHQDCPNFEIDGNCEYLMKYIDQFHSLDEIVGVFHDDDESEGEFNQGKENVLNGMLQVFVNSAERNCTRKKQGYRHDETTKMFAAFLKMISGLLAYSRAT